MSNDNEGVADPSDDQDDSQDIHLDVASGVVADLIGDCERRSRQHEMGQDFHAAFGEHEIGHDNTYKAYDSNEIIDGLHRVRPTVFGCMQLVSRSPYPSMLQKRKATANPAWRKKLGHPTVQTARRRVFAAGPSGGASRAF
jgi:hypothetical protein